MAYKCECSLLSLNTSWALVFAQIDMCVQFQVIGIKNKKYVCQTGNT